jgi:hypothetical protein
MRPSPDGYTIIACSAAPRKRFTSCIGYEKFGLDLDTQSVEVRKADPQDWEFADLSAAGSEIVSVCY